MQNGPNDRAKVFRYPKYVFALSIKKIVLKKCFSFLIHE